MKRTLWIFLILVVAVGGWCVSALLRDYSGWFDYDPNTPLNPRPRLIRTTDCYEQYEVRLSSVEGPDIVGLLNIPRTEPPHPLIIVQGGYHRGKDALNLLGDEPCRRGYALFSMDYRYTGSEENMFLAYFQTKEALREALVDLRRVLDYLDGRDDIDPDRTAMVGVSLGALFGPILTALDGRVDFLALIYGGGNLPEIVRANSTFHPVWTELVVLASRVYYAPFEPLLYADRIAPSPLLMIHGTGDEWVPARCAREFYEKAGEPKKIIWHESGHIRSFQADEIATLVGETLDWLDATLRKGEWAKKP